jgi:hypothetical protein
MRFPSLTRLSSACRRYPLRASPRALQGSSAVKSQTSFRPPPLCFGTTKTPLLLTVSPRSSFPLATPLSPKGNGCSSSCNPKPSKKDKESRHEQQRSETSQGTRPSAIRKHPRNGRAAEGWVGSIAGQHRHGRFLVLRVKTAQHILHLPPIASPSLSGAMIHDRMMGKRCSTLYAGCGVGLRDVRDESGVAEAMA